MHKPYTQKEAAPRARCRIRCLGGSWDEAMTVRNLPSTDGVGPTGQGCFAKDC